MNYLRSMRYIWQHIQAITDTYDGSLPLAHFLKNYYRQHPKLGSRDRKILSDMSYSFYRCNKALPIDLAGFEQRITTALFLCHTPAKHLTGFLSLFPEDIRTATTPEKIEYLRQQDIIVDITALFPGVPHLSAGITPEVWLSSMLQLPRFFIRIRKKAKGLLALLAAQHIDYIPVSDTCISIPNATGIESFIPADWYVVQDASSQATGNYFITAPKQTWWDCCSGAGGKSLLLKDKEPGITLTVSDVRESILHNLKMRFKQYGYPSPEALVMDAAQNSKLYAQLGSRRFDHILCDVPCTGSGTWARTPEQLYFFDTAAIETYADRQRRISINAINYLKPGGRLYYITCSVFAAENEGVLAALLDTGSVTLEQKQLINGTTIHADCMFIAVLRKEEK